MTSTLSAPPAPPQLETASLALEQKRARVSALTERRAIVTSQLAKLRASHARALADGGRGPSTADIQLLAEEQEGLARALELLAGEVQELETDVRVATLAVASRAEDAAIADALEQAGALDERLRFLLETEVMPLADKLTAALKTARAAENHHDHLDTETNGARTFRPDRTGKVAQRFPATFTLIATLRAYLNNRSLGRAHAVSAEAPVTEPADTPSLAFR